MDIRERWNDPQTYLQAILDGQQAAIWTAMPGYVVSFDPVAVTAVVQLTVQGYFKSADGTASYGAITPLPDVPVCFPRGGGYTLTFPVAPGDECLVVFANRNIDAWWQSGGIQQPIDLRMHDLSDGFAIVGPQSQANRISDLSTTSTQLRSNDSTLVVDLNHGSGTITLTAPTVHVTASVAVNVTAPVINLN